MPDLPKRPCTGGCGRLVDGGRCSVCSSGLQKDGRESSAKRGYDNHWRKTREGYLKKHPFCADPFGIHRKAGIPEPATNLDHIEPHKGDKSVFWSRSNWQGLCHSCHSRKTAAEGGFGNSYRHGHTQPVTLDMTLCIVSPAEDETKLLPAPSSDATE